MKIRYVGPATSGVEFDGVVFLPGVPGEVDDEVGARLCEQSVWEAAKAPKKGDTP